MSALTLVRQQVARAAVRHQVAPQALPLESEAAHLKGVQEENAALAERYWLLLQAHLADGDEQSLYRGYEFSRQALMEGCGLLQLSEIHDLALQRLPVDARPEGPMHRAAGAFFAECLSPFEMSHRGAQEGARALRHLNEVLEGELKRIAHVLHDEAGQLLALVHIAVGDVASEVPPQARGGLEKVELLLTQIETELRSLSHEWRPTVLDHLGLLPALELLTGKVAKRTGMKIRLIGNADTRMSSTVETALYRIVQEALNNATRHAQAGNVRIEVQCTPYQVTCSVRDDGKGFDPNRKAQTEGLGLTGIRERVATLGGTLRLISEPANGTTVQVTIPLGGRHANSCS